MKCLFLYNPESGKGTVRKKLGYIKRKLLSKYESVEIVATKSAEDMQRRVENGGEYDLVLFAGGDGTFNLVLQRAAEKGILLGYLPTGTTNDIARSLGIPLNVKGALKAVLTGEERELDCMRAGDRYAMYIAAAGAFTSATYSTPRNRKKTFGVLAYAVEALKHDLKLEVFPVRAVCGEETVETYAVLVLALNGRSVAGFPINREGSMRDGTLETVIIKQAQKPGPLRRLGAYFSVATLFLFGCKVKKKDIILLRGDKISIETGQNVVWDFDGEEGFSGDVEIRVCPRSVRLIVPSRKKS